VVLAKAPYDSIIGTLYSSLFFLISGEKINDILFMITDFLGSISRNTTNFASLVYLCIKSSS